MEVLSGFFTLAIDAMTEACTISFNVAACGSRG